MFSPGESWRGFIDRIKGRFMGQVLYGSATTTEAVHRAIQDSQASVRALAARHRINPKMVQKWKKSAFTHDAAMGPKEARSAVLTAEEEAACIAFRKHTLLPLDDRLYVLQATSAAASAAICASV